MEPSSCAIAIFIIVGLIVIFVVATNLGNRKHEKKAVLHNMEKLAKLESKVKDAEFDITNKIEYRDVLEPQIEIHGKYRDSLAEEYMTNGICFSKEFLLDMDHKKIALIDSFKSKIEIMNFKDVLDVKITEDNSTVMEGGVGRALVGGILAGGAGAIVGATTRGSKNVVSSMQLQIITNDVTDSLKKLDIIANEIPRDSVVYKKATEFSQKIYASITSILKQYNQEMKKESPKDTISKLKELSDMLEKGHLTKEEFQKQKKKILDSSE